MFANTFESTISAALSYAPLDIDGVLRGKWISVEKFTIDRGIHPRASAT